jgi:hypothetical protein
VETPAQSDDALIAQHRLAHAMFIRSRAASRLAQVPPSDYGLPDSASDFSRDVFRIIELALRAEALCGALTDFWSAGPPPATSPDITQLRRLIDCCDPQADPAPLDQLLAVWLGERQDPRPLDAVCIHLFLLGRLLNKLEPLLSFEWVHRALEEFIHSGFSSLHEGRIASEHLVQRFILGLAVHRITQALSRGESREDYIQDKLLGMLEIDRGLGREFDALQRFAKQPSSALGMDQLSGVDPSRFREFLARIIKLLGKVLLRRRLPPLMRDSDKARYDKTQALKRRAGVEVAYDDGKREDLPPEPQEISAELLETIKAKEEDEAEAIEGTEAEVIQTGAEVTEPIEYESPEFDEEVEIPEERPLIRKPRLLDRAEEKNIIGILDNQARLDVLFRYLKEQEGGKAVELFKFIVSDRQEDPKRGRPNLKGAAKHIGMSYDTARGVWRRAEQWARAACDKL